MEPIAFELDGNQLRFSGIPDAVKVVELTGDKAQMLADLTLHRTDLSIAADALRCLPLLNDMGGREAIWRSAVIHYIKCFSGGHAARFKSLNIRDIVQDEAGRQVHRFFDLLRNKHFVHDENSYLQCKPLGFLNDGTKTHRVEKVAAASFAGMTLADAHYGNLSNLVDAALRWIEPAADRLVASITADLERLPSAELDAMPAATMTVPDIQDLGRTRKSVRNPASSNRS